MSNDGSRLYIDNKMVIDNDGQHGKIEKMGALNLSKGKHKFRVEYFQAGGKTVLELRVSGHLLNRESIPVSMLFPEQLKNKTLMLTENGQVTIRDKTGKQFNI